MHRAASSNLVVSGHSCGASIDVVPLTSTEASSAVHNPYVVQGWFGGSKTVHKPMRYYSNDGFGEAKRMLDLDPQLTQDIKKVKKQSDGKCYGVYLDKDYVRFKVGILTDGMVGVAAGIWIKSYNGGNLTREMVDRAIAAYNQNQTDNKWSAPGTTSLDNWYWYQNKIPDLGPKRDERRVV